MMITPLTNVDLILFCTCRRISPLKRSRQERRMMTTMETIYSKTAMTVSWRFHVGTISVGKCASAHGRVAELKLQLNQGCHSAFVYTLIRINPVITFYFHTLVYPYPGLTAVLFYILVLISSLHPPHICSFPSFLDQESIFIVLIVSSSRSEHAKQDGDKPADGRNSSQTRGWVEGIG